MTTVRSTASSRPSDASVSYRVLDEIAEREGVAPTEFDRRLYDVVDPDALDALVSSPGMTGTVEFTYMGYRIAVHGDGRIDVTDGTGSTT